VRDGLFAALAHRGGFKAAINAVRDAERQFNAELDPAPNSI
jgi:hypothetical protein